MKLSQKLLRFLACGLSLPGEDESGLETSEIFENDLDIENMLKQSTTIMENLKVQTECYKAEINALRQEIVRLRLENTARSFSSTNSSRSSDSGHFGSGKEETDTLTWATTLDETLHKVSQTVPVFIDLPIEV